jgi:YD repeat-containing protein
VSLAAKTCRRRPIEEVPAVASAVCTDRRPIARRPRAGGFFRGPRRLALRGVASVAAWLAATFRRGGSRSAHAGRLARNQTRLDLDRFEERAYPGNMLGLSYVGLVGAEYAFVGERLLDPARDVARYWDLVSATTGRRGGANPADDPSRGQPVSALPGSRPANQPSAAERPAAHATANPAGRPAPAAADPGFGTNLGKDVFGDPLAGEWESAITQRGPVHSARADAPRTAGDLAESPGGAASPGRPSEAGAAASAGLLGAGGDALLNPALGVPAVGTSPPRSALSAPAPSARRTAAPGSRGGEGTRSACASPCLYVLDDFEGVVINPDITQDSFAGWSMQLRAQLAGTKATGYNWSFNNPGDVTNVTGSTSSKLTFDWTSFTGVKAETLSLSVSYSGGGPLTMDINFNVEGTDKPAYSATRPATTSTWPTVIPPDAIKVGQEQVANGPYHEMALASGDLHTHHAMPAFNPGIAPLGLTYSSTPASDASGPIFLEHYVVPTGTGTLSTLTASVTFNGVTGSTYTYDAANLAVGSVVEIALQASASGLSTGRYSYSVGVTPHYSPAIGASNTGRAVYLNYSGSDFGAGWSLDGLERLYAVTGTSAGVILDLGGDQSLWFASRTSGTFLTPAGDFSTLTQDTGAPNEYHRTLTDGTVVHYDSSGYEARVVERTGLTTTYSYDGSHHLTAVTHPAELGTLVTTFAYNGSGKLTRVTDPARTMTLGYDGSGNLTSVQDPDGATYTYAYDGSAHLTALTDPLAHTTSFAYSAGRVTLVTRADSSTESLTPLQLDGLPTTTSLVTPVLVAEAKATYTDPRGETWDTRLDWRGFGFATEPEDPRGDMNLLYRDANGLPWLQSDPLADRARLFFNAQGNATEVVVPDGGAVTYAYNAFSEVTQSTDAGGNTTSYGYDAGGRLTALTDALTETTTFTNTTAGFVLTETDPLGHVTTHSYDSRGRLTATVESPTSGVSYTTTYAYDAASDVTALTDANGNATTFTYDGAGRVLTKVLPGSTPATYSYDYDDAGNLTAYAVPVTVGTSLVTGYAYDALNRLTSATDPLSHVRVYGYDAAGNLTQLSDALSHTTTYSYDEAGRRTSDVGPAGLSINYTYDAAGQVTQVQQKLDDGRPNGDTATYTYTYDSMGRATLGTDALGNSHEAVYTTLRR